MARKSEEISVAISPKARGDLASIWRWNAEAYGAAHADRYLEFVINGAKKLGASRLLAKAAPWRSSYSYVLIRKSRRGHDAGLMHELGEAYYGAANDLGEGYSDYLQAHNKGGPPAENDSLSNRPGTWFADPGGGLRTPDAPDRDYGNHNI